MELTTEIARLLSVPQAKLVLGLHKQAQSTRLTGRIVLIYGEGGLRAAKNQMEENVNLSALP